MRIGIIAPPWVPTPPPAYGGTETVIDVLARGLADAGHEVCLFATGDSTAAVPRDYVIETAPGIDVGGSALELRHVARAYERFAAVDLVHDHTILGPLYGARRADVPIVTTNHNPFIEPFVSALRATDGAVPIIAISHAHAGLAGDLPIAAVIHHGIDVARFPLGRGDGGFALFLGRMTAGKGAHRAVRIARAAGIPLVLAGKMHSDAEREYFDKEVAPLLDDEACYVGEVDLEHKLELLTGACCLLNPIAWPEPFGMAMIEALACGTPVLALRAGSSPEIVLDGLNGFLREDEAGLVAALRRVGSIERAQCRTDAIERFSATRMVDEHLGLYEKLIDAAARERRAR